MKTGLMKIVILLVVVLVAQAGAAVPPVISYQGKLMQPNCTPIPDGTYGVRFAIYYALAGDLYPFARVLC